MFSSNQFKPSSLDRRHSGSQRMLTMISSFSLAALVLTGCSSVSAAETSSVVTTSISDETAQFFNNDSVHDISVEADSAQITAAIASYTQDESKDWIKATVTIDGHRFENVGLRLKGNSTLRGASTTSEASELPWMIRLDKYVEGQQYSGRSYFVVRTSSTESSMNEAVALNLLASAGLATEHAAATKFSLNGSDAQLRLVIDNPNDDLYNEESFEGSGITYKADSSGDYSYRGDAGSDYESAFSAESGTSDDLTPVADFLDFVNNSSDEDFASKLSEHLDVDQFAKYLAMMDLVSNTDDIDGPGNNSYLRYDSDSGKMTVVAWDLNMSYGSMGAMGKGKITRPTGEKSADGQLPTLPDGAKPPTEGTMPEGFDPENMPAAPEASGTDAQTKDFQAKNRGGKGGGLGGKSNPLVTRFLANDDFKAQYEQATANLQAKLYDSGLADQILTEWSDMLVADAKDLIDEKTVKSEAETIRKFFTSSASDENASGAPAESTTDQKTSHSVAPSASQSSATTQTPATKTKDEEQFESSASPTASASS